MSSAPKLKYNIIYNVAYQILSIIVPLITAPYVFRILGKEGVGLYGYSFSVAHYFSLFCMLGILNYGVREVSKVNHDISKRSRIFQQIFAIQLCSGILSLITYLVIVTYFVHSNTTVFLIQGLFVVASMLDVSWFLFGMENFKTTTIISVINKVITTICIFLLIRKPSDVYLYAAILSLGSLLNNVFYWIIVKKHTEYIKNGFAGFNEHVKPILILFIPVIAINIYKYIDKIMLGSMMSVTDVGIFEAAEKLQNFPLCLIAAFGTVMLPRISNMVANKKSGDVARYNMLSFVIIMFLTFGLAFGLAGISQSFIPIFYGEGYEDSVDVLLWLLPSMVFVGWANIIRTQYLLPRCLDRSFCISVIAGAVINVIANFFLIPLYGAIGAAISTTIAELTVCTYQSVIAFNGMSLSIPLKKSIPFFFVGIITYIIIMLIKTNSPFLTISLQMIVGIITYLMLSVLPLRRCIK